MALPPSQYSVLDADAIVRMSDDNFRCEIGGISFFGAVLGRSVRPSCVCV